MYKIGQIVEGRITGIQPYGAFVALDHQTTGLIHISEISDGYVRSIDTYVTVGETVRVKIIDFDYELNQARLSLKALHKPHSRYRRRPSVMKAELPEMRIGFASIAENLNRWMDEALAEISEEEKK